MATILDAFKLKPYDLEPVFATWTDGPIFRGEPKTDLPIDEWLDKIKAGCEERKIPEEYWYKVGQHFMGPKAKARLDELKAVITKVHGGKYRWSWKKYKVAMQSMSWGIDAAQKETIKVEKTTGSWWVKKKPSKQATSTSTSDAAQPTLSKSSSFWIKRSPGEISTSVVAARSDTSGSEGTKKTSGDATEGAPLRRAASDFWPIKKKSQDNPEERPPLPPKSNSDVAVVTTTPRTPSRSSTIESISVEDSTAVAPTTTVTEAPIWLLNACTALEYITSEHPKAMSIISAILITAGSIPAIPAISAGAGGAVLASGAAHAIGAIAVGLGQALSISVKNQNQQNQPAQVQAPSSVR